MSSVDIANNSTE